MTMRSGKSLHFANAVYWLLLAAWLGSLLMSGASAGMTFGTMKRLDVRIPAFEAYAGEHWRIAAGQVQNNVFFLNDLIQFVACVGVVIILGLHVTVYRMSLRQFSNALRTTMIAFLMISVSYQLLVLGPRMNLNLREYWDGAMNGDDVTAAQAAFEADHPTATRLLAFNLLCVAVTIVASSIALSSTEFEADRTKGGAKAGGAGRATPLQEPELLKKLGIS